MKLKPLIATKISLFYTSHHPKNLNTTITQVLKIHIVGTIFFLGGGWGGGGAGPIFTQRFNIFNVPYFASMFTSKMTILKRKFSHRDQAIALHQ